MTKKEYLFPTGWKVNVFFVEMGEGIPEVNGWNFEQDGMLYARDYDSVLDQNKEISTWLDGTSPRWAKRTATAPHDGLSLSDGTYLDIIGGNSYQQEDGSEIGWKERLVPKEKQADEMEVNLMHFPALPPITRTKKA